MEQLKMVKMKLQRNKFRERSCRKASKIWFSMCFLI